MDFFSDRVHQNCVFWNRSQLPVVAWHFQFSMLAVRSRIATGRLSRIEGSLRHIWAWICGHCVGHRALRCTTPSAASEASLHHFGCGAEQVGSTAVRHHRTGNVRASPSARTSPFLLRVCPGAAASHCLFPFVVYYSTYATSPTASSRAAGWVSPAATSVPFCAFQG